MEGQQGPLPQVAIGSGLVGDGSGGAPLAVDFAGTGSASTAARSDHAHGWGELTDVPAGFTDGVDDTLDETAVDAFVADNGYALAVDTDAVAAEVAAARASEATLADRLAALEARLATAESRPGTLVWVDAAGNETTVHGESGRLYFDPSGNLWQIDADTGEILPRNTTGFPYVFESNDCSGLAFVTEPVQLPRVTFSLWDGSVWVRNDTISKQTIAACSILNASGCSLYYGGPAGGPCPDPPTSQQALLVSETTQVTMPVVPYTFPLHPEIR